MEGFSGNTEGSHMDNFPEHLSLNDQGQFNPEYTLEASELTNAEKSKPGYGRPNKSL